MPKLVDRIKALFINILCHPERLKVIGETWEEVYAGNVEFDFEGIKLVVFNDCDSFDYVDEIVFPDGEKWESYEERYEKELQDAVEEVAWHYHRELLEIFSKSGEVEGHAESD